MNAHLSERDERLLAKALEAKEITGLEICRVIQDVGCGSMHFLELSRELRKSPRQTVRDLTIVRMAVGMAESAGLICSDENNELAFTGKFAYQLTDVGRHVLMTAVTGPAAHAVLADIEEEMAGAA